MSHLFDPDLTDEELGDDEGVEADVETAEEAHREDHQFDEIDEGRFHGDLD